MCQAQETQCTKHTRCQTPHLTEDEIKAAFVRVANKIITDRKEILKELRAIRTTISGTESLESELRHLETEQKRLAEQMNADADAVNGIIAENARTAQDQGEYALRYDALVSRFEETKAKYDAVTAEIAMKGVRKREFDRFIRATAGDGGGI